MSTNESLDELIADAKERQVQSRISFFITANDTLIMIRVCTKVRTLDQTMLQQALNKTATSGSLHRVFCCFSI